MRTFRERFRNQQGMALVGVMLLLILASGVCAALAVSGKTETMAAYNLDTSAQARAAAQAGLTASAQVLIEYLENTPDDVKTAMTKVLIGPDADPSTGGDNGSLWAIDVDGDGTATPTGLPNPGTKLLLNNITGVSYEVVALDDDNWAARGGTAGSSDDIGEVDPLVPPFPAYNDYNRRLVVRAVGHGRNNTTVILEGIISRPQLGGIVVGADLRMGGAAGSVSGESAGIHANGSLDFDGTPDIDGTVSAVGTIAGSPIADSILAGQDPIYIPPINSSDFPNFEWELRADQTVWKKDVAGVWSQVCDASSDDCRPAAKGGVDFFSGHWRMWATASDRYHVIGDVESRESFTATLYATGDININATHDVTNAANAKGVALVTDGNLSMDNGADVTGSIYVRERLEMIGTHTIIGQVVAENRSDPTAENWFAGNVDIIWSGDTMIGNFGVSSWREVK